MSTLATRLAMCLADIRACETRAGRTANSVKLIAVSKKHPPDMIRAAAALGQRAFGENYVAEALQKQAALADPTLEWHFIGAIQSNKTADIARSFAWVHTLDRLRIAERLDRQRPDDAPALNVLIQVNISSEASKGGIPPEALPELMEAVATLPRLALRGLMALPAPTTDIAQQRAAFAAMAELARGAAVPLPELSLGTSEDYAAAIAEGATMVRLGTVIFGPRPAPA